MKMLILGLDGATLDLIKPWSKEGKLPNFAKILKNGVHGDLGSTIPPVTCSAWASFITGKNPGKHGVFDFEKTRLRGYERHVVNATDIDGQTLWSVLSEAGKRVIAIGVPLTYPPPRVNGIIIAGFLSPGDSVYVYPPDIKKVLTEEIGYRVYPHTEWGDDECALDAWLQDLYLLTDKQAQACLHFLRNYPWDLFMVVFSGTDWISHNFWKYADPKCLGFNKERAKKYGSVILEYYQKIDSILGNLIKHLEKDTLLIVMSDHGQGPIHKIFYVNEFLKELGLLKLKNRSRLTPRNPGFWLQKMGFTNERIYAWLSRHSRVMKIAKWLVSTFSVGFSMSRDIDWSRTKAYDNGFMGQIRINLKEREPRNINDEFGEEYITVKKYITKKLYELRDAETGEMIVDKVFSADEVYSGPHTREAPDLVFLCRRGYVAYKGFDIDSKQLWRDPTPPIPLQSSKHEINGLFMSYGKDIKEGYAVPNVNIVDITPLILHVMRVPIPIDMDGRVLREIFKEGSEFAKKPIVYQETEKRLAEHEEVFTDENEERTKERLRKLGYL